ncbi:MAG TPA: hypothetical protein VE173_02895, partial [Longimicrobiales bacterium]|nr:hypothetical protein [Longimicrobiales bacterium]
MLKTLVEKVIGSRHEREVRKSQPIVDEINEIQEGLEGLGEEEFRGKTGEFRERIAERTRELEERIQALREEKRHSEDPDHRQRLTEEIAGLQEDLLETMEDTLDELLPEAFAVVKEACRRLLGSEVTFTGTKSTWDMVPYDVQLIGAIAL